MSSEDLSKAIKKMNRMMEIAMAFGSDPCPPEITLGACVDFFCYECRKSYIDREIERIDQE